METTDEKSNVSDGGTNPKVPESKTNDAPGDPDLDDLLDSALDDFDKEPEPPKKDTEITSTPGNDQNVPAPAAAAGEDEFSTQQEELFNELFNIAGVEAGEEGDVAFEDMMKALMAGQPDMLKQIGKMSENLAETGESDANPAGLDDTLQQTMNNLAQNVEGMQDAGSEGDILRMLSGMGLGEDGASGEESDMDVLPMMQNMMKSLMSKEVLYPSLKEISDKYPSWLEENRSKISKPEHENYSKQYEYMKVIVTEFESEKSDDSESVKKSRFDKILDVMQRMQELGQPPKDLVGEMPAGMDLGENGFPKVPGVPEQCSVM